MLEQSQTTDEPARMQEGIVNEDAADLARRAGLAVVMDTCMRVAHRRLGL